VWSSYILDNSLLSTDDTAVVERMLCKVDICVRIPVLDLFDGLLEMGTHGLARAGSYTVHGEIVDYGDVSGNVTTDQLLDSTNMPTYIYCNLPAKVRKKHMFRYVKPKQRQYVRSEQRQKRRQKELRTHQERQSCGLIINTDICRCCLTYR